MYIISKLVFDRARIQIQPKPLNMGASTGYHRNELSREEGEGQGKVCVEDAMFEGSLKRGELAKEQTESIPERKRNHAKT